MESLQVRIGPISNRRQWELTHSKESLVKRRPVSDSTFAREDEVAMFLIGLFMGAIFGFAVAVILEAGKLPDLFTGE